MIWPYGGQNRKYRFLHFRIYLYFRNRSLEEKIIMAQWKLRRWEKNSIIPKIEIHCVLDKIYTWLYKFQKHKVWHLFLTISCVKKSKRDYLKKIKGTLELSFHAFYATLWKWWTSARKLNYVTLKSNDVTSHDVTSWWRRISTRLKMSEPVTFSC